MPSPRLTTLENAVAILRELAVAREFRRRDRFTQVVNLFARCKRTIEGNPDHDVVVLFLPTSKSDPPAGKERPALMTARSMVRIVSKVLSSGRLISNSSQRLKGRSRFFVVREKIMSGKRRVTKDVMRSTRKPASSTFLHSSARR